MRNIFLKPINLHLFAIITFIALSCSTEDSVNVLHQEKGIVTYIINGNIYEVNNHVNSVNSFNQRFINDYISNAEHLLIYSKPDEINTFYLFNSAESYLKTFPKNEGELGNAGRTASDSCEFRADLTLFEEYNFQPISERVVLSMNERYARIRSLENVKNRLDDRVDFRNKTSSLKLTLSSLTSECGDFLLIMHDYDANISATIILREAGDQLNIALSNIPNGIGGTWNNSIDAIEFRGGCEIEGYPIPVCN